MEPLKHASTPRRPPVILLVDDEVDLVDLLGEALGLSLPKHDILTATSSQEASTSLHDLKHAKRSLALLMVDQELGGHSGLDVLLQSRNDFPNCAQLVYTGRADKATIDKAQRAGIKVLFKPLSLDELVREIRLIL